MGHKYCAVLLADEQTKDLRIHGAFGLSHKYIQTLNNELVQKTQGGGPMSRSVTAQAYRTRMPVYAPDITSDQRFTTWREAALEAGYKSIVALPLIFRE
jgi:GAF domain-containing protein